MKEITNCEYCAKPFERQVRAKPRRYCTKKCEYNDWYFENHVPAEQASDGPLSEVANLWLKRPWRSAVAG